MKTAFLWLRVLPMVAAAAFSCAAAARPLLVPPQNLTLPLPGDPVDSSGYLDPFYFGVAIDGGRMLVYARRAINIQNDRVDGVYIFERNAAGRWAYAGVLTEQWPGDVMINGTVATTSSADGFRVFERGAAGWALSGTITIPSTRVFRIEDSSIFARQDGRTNRDCVPPFQQFRKVNGTWTQVATIGGVRCDQNQPDINDGRAIVVHTPLDSPTPQPPAELFAASGASTWTPIGNIPAPPPGPVYVNWFGPWGTIRGDTAYIDRGYFYRNAGGNTWVGAGRLIEPEIELSPYSYEGKLRGNNLFLYGYERDYELPSPDWETLLDWRVLRVYRQTATGAFVYHARLNSDFDVWRWSVSEDGRQVAAYGGDSNNSTYNEPRRLYVFEVPDSATFPTTQQDTFRSGNYSRWTATAGSFDVVTSGVTRVLRQSSLAGDAGAHLTAVAWTDQSIEADMRPLEFAGAGRWFGLVTRRSDAQNYYYVTFRSPNVISLRRMRDGVLSELAATYASANFQTGRNYRMRLESVGDQHVVFIDGVPLLHTKDTTLAQGHPGVAGYRTRFDVDNVVVSGGTRTLLRLDSNLRGWSEGWLTASGTWQFASDGDSGFLRQSDNQADARWVSKTAVGNQVISARVRPQSHGTGNDPWIGIAAHVVDDSNYYYLSLRRSQQLSLRRLVNGQIQVLATVPQALTLGAWHDLRLETVGTNIRAYVNGELKIETTDSTLSGGGRNALLMWKTAADLESYVAYQP